MRDQQAIRERYLRDDLPVRLGGLAANLRRIKSFAARDANQAAVESLIDESKCFIEWSAAEVETAQAAELVELQVQLACWQYRWTQIWPDVTRRAQMAEQARMWSDRVLNLSELLSA